jgi:hypothetical protein
MLSSPVAVNLNQARKGVALLNSTKQGTVLVRVDDAVAQIRSLSFAHAVDIENVTPAEIVTAINNAGFTGISAFLDGETQSCNIQATNPNTQFVQIFGLLAGALGFGGGTAFRSFGSFLHDGITWKDTVSLTTARQSASGNTISLADGIDGGSTDIIQNGGRTGDQITWAIRNRDYLLK